MRQKSLYKCSWSSFLEQKLTALVNHLAPEMHSWSLGWWLRGRYSGGEINGVWSQEGVYKHTLTHTTVWTFLDICLLTYLHTYILNYP